MAALLCGVVAAAALRAAPPRSIELLPGQAKTSAWPHYLFLFRGALGDFRLDEVRAVADAVGVDASRLHFEPAGPVPTGATDQPRFSSPSGGDVGPDLLQWVSLPNADAAALVAARCSLVRCAFDVWAGAHFERSTSPMARREALDEAGARWQLLADAVQAEGLDDDRQAMLSPLGDGSWRVDIYSIGWTKPRALPAKIALMETLDSLLWGLPGDVDLHDPRHVVAMVEDCRGAEAFSVVGDASTELVGSTDDEQRAARGEISEADADGEIEDLHAFGEGGGVGGGGGVGACPPCRAFLGQQLSVGDASHLAKFALTDRPYLGRTTLPPALAMLMANQARVVGGSLVLDPYCGTASTLLSCAARGARVVGVEIDERVLRGGKDGEGIRHNFEHAGLPPPELLLHGDAENLDELLEGAAAANVAGDAATADASGGAYDRFDAIVTDPPYGLMEGLGALYRPLRERLSSLLCLAARRLRVGGRLVFLLPLPASAPSLSALPLSELPPLTRCLELESTSRQRVSLRMHRLMVTMRKVAEPAEPTDGAGADASMTSRPSPAIPRRSADGGGAAPWEDWWNEKNGGV